MNFFILNKACGNGFLISNDTCVDYDECLKKSTNKVLSQGFVSCSAGAECSNRVGGYACVCKYGFQVPSRKTVKTAVKFSSATTLG